MAEITPIKKVAVIGAGVMGAGIAAHVANSGTPVVLLDIVPPGLADGGDRSAIAKGAVDKLLKADPAAFMSKAAAKLVTAGNIEDDLALLAECDWIVEAVVERLDVKQALYAKIDAVRKPGSAVSSNTSTIPLDKLVGGLSDAFAADFLVTHFFNPPRYMRLLEVVAGEKTRPAAVASVSRFADVSLGKSVVACKDRPGFIANRLGVTWLQAAVVEAFDMGVTVEDADAIIGRPFGIPKTGVFALLDLVGLDLMPHVNASLAGALPKEDMFHDLYRPAPLIEKMIRDGYTGRKGKGGFYRVNREKNKAKEAIDLSTGEYRAQKKASVSAIGAAGRSLTKLFDHDSVHGRYAFAVMGRTLAYAALLVGDAADEIDSIDEAMRLGYNWKKGPFELIDDIGVEWFVARLEKAGLPVAPILRTAAGRSFYRIEDGRRQALGLDGAYRDVVRPDGVLMLADVKLTSKPILKNGSAALWDIGDGVVCFEFTSKMNSLDPRHHRPAAEVDRRGEEVLQGDGRLQRGLAVLGRRQSRPRPVRRQHRGVDGDRQPDRLGTGDLQGAALCAVPGGRGALGHGARRRLRDLAALLGDPGPCRDLHGSGRGRRRPAARLGRLQGTVAPVGRQRPSAQGADAGDRQSLRDDLHRPGRQVGGGSPGDDVPGPRRRHHHEPLPPARRRQGQGAGTGRGLCPAGSADLRAPRSVGPLRPQHGGGELRPARQGDAARRGGLRRGRRRAVGRRRRRDQTDHRGRPLPTRTRGLHAPRPQPRFLSPVSSTCSRPASRCATEERPMPSYKAPLRDMRFCLYELMNGDDLTALPGYEDFGRDLVDPVLEEAAKLCEEVLFPLNRSGDEEGCTIENGVVRTPKGFKEAYTLFREGGWTSIACDPAFGGQGLPAAVNTLVEEMICSSNLSFGMYPGLSHGAYVSLISHGSEGLKEKYLPKLVDGTWSGTMCLTEPHCGTDLGMLRTAATPQDDGSYAITGTKIFISAGEHDLTENILHLVLARIQGAPQGGEGHLAVPGAEVFRRRGRCDRRSQRRLLRRHRAQDGHQGLVDLRHELR